MTPSYLLAALAVLAATARPAVARLQTCVLGGDGTLGFPEYVQSNCSPFGLAVGDLNGDGWPDLVSGCSVAHVLIALGNGAGGFGSPAVVSVGSSPRAVFIGELGGGAAPDILSVGQGEVTVLLGVGDGLIAASSSYPLQGSASHADLADLNSDGWSDVLVTFANPNVVTVLLGVGDGSLVAAPEVSATNPQSVRLGDLNADGVVDLLLTDNSSLNFLAGVGDGTFLAPQLIDSSSVSSPLVADVDLDGIPDLVTSSGSGGVAVRRGTGGGALVAPTFYGGPTMIGGPLRVMDLNTDGLPDIVGLARSGGFEGVAVILGTDNGVFGLTSVYDTGEGNGLNIYDPAVSDLDRDGALDVILVNVQPGQIVVLRGNPRGGDEDEFAPNASCSSASALTPGLYPDLTTFRSTADDFFRVEVSSGGTLEVEIRFNHDDGDIDCYLYDASTLGSTCGNKLDYLARGYTATDDESITWINSTGATQTYYLQVALWNNANNADCNTYDLSVAITTPSFGTSMCAGDGSLIGCPCDNESADPEEGCHNSKNAGAKIAATGTPQISNHDAVFHLTQGIPGDPALLIEGRSMIASPFRDGILCMGGFTTRLQAVMMDGDGNAATSGSIAGATNLVPGQTRYYQWWYRDPGGVSPCGTGSNFSNGLAVAWQ